MAIVNVVGSSIAREADNGVLHTCWSGDFCCYDQGIQRTACCYVCLAVQFAIVRGKITESSMATIFLSCRHSGEDQKILEDKERIQWFAAKYANAHDVFFVGSGIDYAVCLEGSLEVEGDQLYPF